MTQRSKELKETPCSKLILRQGMVRMNDDAPSGEYLRAWQTKNGHPDGTAIRILTHEDYKKLLFTKSLAGIA